MQQVYGHPATVGNLASQRDHVCGEVGCLWVATLLLVLQSA